MGNLEEKLQAPFPASEIEWRIGRSGVKSDNSIWATALAYIQNRAIMNRLDEVFGCESWQNKYREWHNDSQLCGISVFNGATKSWVTKWDGADATQFESTKGGLSDSMKRAGVQWGIGRYLYNLEETWVKTSSKKVDGWNYQPQSIDKKTGKVKVPAFYWATPELPDWALPNQLEESIKKDLGGKSAGEVMNKQTDRNYTQEVNECKSLDELKTYYALLSSEEKKKYKNLLTNKKAEFLEA